MTIHLIETYVFKDGALADIPVVCGNLEPTAYTENRTEVTCEVCLEDVHWQPGEVSAN